MSSKKPNFFTLLRLKSGANETTTVVSPLSSDRIVGIWLAGCSFMVAGSILIGGYTRLKNAGLSMVKWKLVDDMFLPNNEDKWLKLYEEYKQYPEYNLSTDEITLTKFKKIYFLEYFHRLWGRLTGVVFLIPSILLYTTGKLKGIEKRVLIYNLLVLAQGVMGWYMVKSGLDEKTMSTHGDPGVSQYRLALHLVIAFGLFSLVTWQAIKKLSSPLKVAPGFIANIKTSTTMSSHIAMFLLLITSFYGALVAGMDAGKVCDTYPKMNGKWIPDGINEITPAWKNLFENPLTAQFIHRFLAHITVGACFYSVYKALKITSAPKRLLFDCSCVISFMLLQMHFGIKTVNTGVDIESALNHQLGAIVLLTSLISLSYNLSRLRKGQFIKIRES